MNVYTSDGCLVFPRITVTNEDKAALRASTVSDDFIRDIKSHNEIHDAICKKKPKFYEAWL